MCDVLSLNRSSIAHCKLGHSTLVNIVLTLTVLSIWLLAVPALAGRSRGSQSLVLVDARAQILVHSSKSFLAITLGALARYTAAVFGVSNFTTESGAPYEARNDAVFRTIYVIIISVVLLTHLWVRISRTICGLKSTSELALSTSLLQLNRLHFDCIIMVLFCALVHALRLADLHDLFWVILAAVSVVLIRLESKCRKSSREHQLWVQLKTISHPELRVDTTSNEDHDRDDYDLSYHCWVEKRRVAMAQPDGCICFSFWPPDQELSMYEQVPLS